MLFYCKVQALLDSAAFTEESSGDILASAPSVAAAPSNLLVMAVSATLTPRLLFIFDFWLYVVIVAAF